MLLNLFQGVGGVGGGLGVFQYPFPFHSMPFPPPPENLLPSSAKSAPYVVKNRISLPMPVHGV